MSIQPFFSYYYHHLTVSEGIKPAGASALLQDSTAIRKQIKSTKIFNVMNKLNKEEKQVITTGTNW